MKILRQTGIAAACLAIGTFVAPQPFGGPTNASAEDTLVQEAAFFSPGKVHFSSLKGLSRKHVDIANRITSRFAAAGYGRPQQIAAVSVAIRESTLNPKAYNGGCHCYGLFQLSRFGGLGRGYSVAALTNPDNNIALIIGEANRFPSFRKARSVDEAVGSFVRNVTRPANKSQVVSATVRTARMVERHAQ